MSFYRVFSIALILSTCASSNAQAQSAQPVVAPWSVDSTQSQSRIRAYENYKSLHQPANSQDSASTESKSYEYAYQPQGSSLPKVVAYSSAQARSNLATQKPSSPLEKMYSRRIVDELSQFGYDLFGVPSDDMRGALSALAEKNDQIPSGAVQDHFVLGQGDTLDVTFTGQRTDRGIYKITNEGLLLIRDFPPIPASGRTIGQVRISLDAAAANLHNTNVHLSLASVRQIGVLVVGHVKRPGKRTMTVFHTIMDALMESGGVDKSGSLRRIKLVRDGRSMHIDLYSLLLHGATNIDFQLKDGDRLIIPPIGPTVAIAGEVKRPGIYEILPKSTNHINSRSENLSLGDMLSLAGGALAPGKTRYLKLGINEQGQEQVQELKDEFKPAFSDGSILMVSKGEEKRAAYIELQGHTLRPGLYAYDENKTLSDLLSSSDLLDKDIYPLIGVIERWNDEQLTRELIDFPLKNVLSGKFDRRLQNGDVIHLFSNAQIHALNNAAQMPSDQNPLLQEASFGSSSARINNELQDFIDDPVMRSFLNERAAFIRGAVRLPGSYPVSEGLSLDTIIATAGGLALEANTSNIEVTAAHNNTSTYRARIDLSQQSPQDTIISAGDSVRVNQKFDKIADNSVLIMGEVKNPGRYDLMPGDKVSDLLMRAGGLNEQAYPFGAIFSRESARKAEEMRFQSQAAGIEQSIAAALESDSEKVGAGQIAEARALARQLKNAQGVGRITVEADPAMLESKPELDMLLQSGDRLYIPRRDLSVRVSGEVLSPASLQFRDEKASLDYIHEAGGFSFHADKDRAFVIYPDGSAQPLQVSAWNYNPVMIPPGSTIVVPRDPKPFDFIQSAKDVSQILSNLAVTAIFVDDLRDD